MLRVENYVLCDRANLYLYTEVAKTLSFKKKGNRKQKSHKHYVSLNICTRVNIHTLILCT